MPTMLPSLGGTLTAGLGAATGAAGVAAADEVVVDEVVVDAAVVVSAARSLDREAAVTFLVLKPSAPKVSLAGAVAGALSEGPTSAAAAPSAAPVAGSGDASG